jgi:hypothetical protein
MEPCEGCGLVVDGGIEGCQLLFDELRGRQVVASTYQIQRLTPLHPVARRWVE